MVMAFVMIMVGAGEQLNWDKIVSEKVGKTKNVKEVYHIFGRYDLIVRIEVEKFEQITTAVEEIRAINGVASTETFIVEKK